MYILKFTKNIKTLKSKIQKRFYPLWLSRIDKLLERTTSKREKIEKKKNKKIKNVDEIFGCQNDMDYSKTEPKDDNSCSKAKWKGLLKKLTSSGGEFDKNSLEDISRKSN